MGPALPLGPHKLQEGAPVVVLAMCPVGCWHLHSGCLSWSPWKCLQFPRAALGSPWTSLCFLGGNCSVVCSELCFPGNSSFPQKCRAWFCIWKRPQSFKGTELVSCTCAFIESLPRLHGSVLHGNKCPHSYLLEDRKLTRVSKWSFFQTIAVFPNCF